MSRRDSVLVNRSLYQIGILTLVASIVWVAVGVYTAIINPLAVEIDKNMLSPLPPSLDLGVIENLTKRLKIEPSLEIAPTTDSVVIENSETDDTIVVDQKDEPTN